MTRVRVPLSGLSGIGWPAVPRGRDTAVLALQHQLDRTQWWSPKDLRAMQLRQLESLAAHAARTVPFYQDRLKVLAGIRKGGLTMEAWRRIPILRRADIQEAAAEMASRAPPKDHGQVTEAKTSGSTGRPITVKVTAVTGLFFAALNLRYHLWFDRDFTARVAGIRSISGLQAAAAAANKPLPWVPGYPSGPMYFFDISRPVGEQLEWLARVQPDYLLTNPSNLQALVERGRQQGFRFTRLRDVTTMGEALDEATREAGEEGWGVPVRDIYSAEEMGLIALQCPERPHYHVQSESLLVEILNDADAPCGPGEAGRVVLTDLHNYAMPLIRYELGDYAVAGAPCPCGRGLPVIERVLGRQRNMLTLPSGDVLWPNLPPKPLTAIASLRQFQIVQTSLDEIEVKVVAAGALSAEEEERFRAYLVENFRHPFAIRFIHVDEIPRSPSGKFEGFISLVGRPASRDSGGPGGNP